MKMRIIDGEPTSLAYPPELRVGVKKAIKVWEAFCALPEAERTKFSYNRADGMGVGYEIKKTEGISLDLKENFHFTFREQKWLEATAARVNESATSLVREAADLVASIIPLVKEYADSIEENLGLDLTSETLDSKPTYYLRFLHYFGNRQAGEEIATAHTDKSGFTLHLFESAPGLQYLNQKKEWRDMPVGETETVIIPGMQLQFKSEGKLKAICHRVVATPKTAKAGRFSIVCFIALNKTLQYNKKGAGRLQEFPAGFNYDMSFSEFSRLFE